MRLFIIFSILYAITRAQEFQSDASPSTDEIVERTSPTELLPTDEKATSDPTNIDEQDEDDYESYEDEKEQEQEDDNGKEEGEEEEEDKDSTPTSVTEEGKEEEEDKDGITTLTATSLEGSTAETEAFETTDEDGEGEETTSAVTSTSARLGSTLTTMAEASTRNVPLTTSRPCFDKINPNTGRSDCPFRRNLCMEASYIQLMRVQCPRTCGFCGLQRVHKLEPVIDACNDLTNPRTGISDCPNRRPLCRNTVYQKLMREQCPRTCGFCNTRFIRSNTQNQKDCSDSLPSVVCLTRRRFCQHNDTHIRRQMKTQCALTCKMCLASNALP